MNRGAWQAIVHRVSKSQTQLKRLACTLVMFNILQLLEYKKVFFMHNKEKLISHYFHFLEY